MPLKERLRTSSGVGLVGRQHLGLQGRGGVGKSVLAAAVCHDHEGRSWFPDGIHGVSLGESPDLVAVQRDLARQLGEEPTFSTPLDGLRDLQGLLAGGRCLLVVETTCGRRRQPRR